MRQIISIEKDEPHNTTNIKGKNILKKVGSVLLDQTHACTTVLMGISLTSTNVLIIIIKKYNQLN